ncbi:MAG: kinase [Lachnospiraceae bacterium]|nr:kinase [Lachnospiraceae bacterium]
MGKLIILRGNSGSGKTTVAKELQNRFGRNTMIISQDMVRREILKVKDGENTQAIPLMKELLIYGNNHSDVVILEGIMYADWYKPLFELAVRLYGSNIYAYYFDLTFEETLKRHQTKPNCHEFGEEAMRRWWREKDFSDILNEVSITAEKSMESIVNNIYDTVSGKEPGGNCYEEMV